MDDLISRAAAIDAHKRAAYWQDGERKIAELPAVDAVPVVRCKDCKHCFDEDRETPYDGESWWYCGRWDKETCAYGTDPYRFYCADGERREDEENSDTKRE